MPDDLKGKDDRDEPTTAEKVVMAASMLVTLALLGYLGWEIVALPNDAPPTASVDHTTTAPDGSLHVTVRLSNPSSVGLRDAEVEVMCDDPPPAITFSHIPAHGSRTGVVVCPPGTEGTPDVGVSYWIST